VSRFTSLADVTLDTCCGSAGQQYKGERIPGSKVIVDDLHRTERGKHDARDERTGQRCDINRLFYDFYVLEQIKKLYILF